MAHVYNSAVAFSSTSPMVRVVVGSMSTSIDVDTFANGAMSIVATFSMMALPSCVDTPMSKLGIGRKTMAPEMGAASGSLAILADDGVVRGLGTAAPVPPYPSVTL